MAHIFDLFSKEDLETAVQEKLINVRESEFGWKIYNYSDRAMFTPGSWDSPAVRQCRGLIVDGTGTIRARPYSKFFNLNQPEADVIDLDEPVLVMNKEDGSLGILFKNPCGDVQVATRGSFASDQAIWATNYVQSNQNPLTTWVDGFTPVVEIVYSDNRVVLNYGDYEGLILLGGVWIESGKYVSPQEASDLTGWNGRIADEIPYRTLRQAVQAEPRPGTEGYAIRALTGDTNRMLKIKEEEYIKLHRIIFGLSERTIWEWRVDNPWPTPIEGLMGGVPDELHAWMREVDSDLLFKFKEIEDQVEGAYETIMSALPLGHSTRKEYAIAAMVPEYRKLAPYMFLRFDNRSLQSAIMKNIKPKGDKKALVRTEDIA